MAVAITFVLRFHIQRQMHAQLHKLKKKNIEFHVHNLLIMMKKYTIWLYTLTILKMLQVISTMNNPVVVDEKRVDDNST